MERSVGYGIIGVEFVFILAGNSLVFGPRPNGTLKVRLDARIEASRSLLRLVYIGFFFLGAWEPSIPIALYF